jgi:hypothetical protein
MLLPIILGIAAKAAGTAITAGQAVAIGTATAAGMNLIKDSLKDDVVPDDDDDLEELIEILKEKRLRRMKKKV